MIGELIAAFLGGAAGAAVGVRYFPGAWPWERTKQAGAGPLIGPADPRPVLYDQDEDTPPRGIPPVWTTPDFSAEAIMPDLFAPHPDAPHPLDIEERSRKWAERRRIAEAKPKPVGL